MTKKSETSLFAEVMSSPLLYLGMGVGLLFGFIVASGFRLDGTDVARFAGGLTGSLIAVAGAISLYFLKEVRDERRRRERMRSLLETTVTLAYMAVERLTNGTENNKHDINAVAATYWRAFRLAQNHEFDDEVVSECYFWLKAVVDRGLLQVLEEAEKPLDAGKIKIAAAALAKSAHSALKSFGEPESKLTDMLNSLSESTSKKEEVL